MAWNMFFLSMCHQRCGTPHKKWSMIAFQHSCKAETDKYTGKITSLFECFYRALRSLTSLQCLFMETGNENYLLDPERTSDSSIIIIKRNGTKKCKGNSSKSLPKPRHNSSTSVLFASMFRWKQQHFERQ